MNQRQKKKHKQIRNLLANLTDREFFTSRSYHEFISKLVRWLGQKQDTILVLDYKEGETADIAYTDGNILYLNTANKITRLLPGRTDKIKSHKGLVAHECGHLHCSDFKRRGKYLGGFCKWRVYPNPPQVQWVYEKKAWEEMKGFLISHNIVAAMVIRNTASYINNLLEDVYIESYMCKEYQGSVRKNLQHNAALMIATIPTESERKAQKCDGLTIMLDMLFRYARGGRTDVEAEYSKQYRSRLNSCRKIIDEAVVSDDPDIRFSATNRLMLKLWKYIRQTIKTAEKSLKNYIEQLSEEELKQKIQDYLKRKMIWIALSEVLDHAEGMEGPEPEFDGWDGDLEGSEETHTPAKLNKELEKELGKMRGGSTSDEGQEEDPEIARESEDLLEKMADEWCSKEEERELERKLQQEADEMKLEGIHQNSVVEIHRQTEIPSHMEEVYKMIAPEIRRIANKLEETVEEALKRREGGKLSGLYIGKRLSRGELYRQDDKLFEKAVHPEEDFSIAFAVLFDISASMREKKRLEYEKKAGLVLHAFCRKLGIPIMMYGHTTHETSDHEEVVEIWSYADFDSADNQDHLRIMGIKTGYRNRDGLALRFVGKKLLARPEEIKILVMLTDGQPRADGYSGSIAKEDLQEAKHDLKKKGIELFCAAIGEDREMIEDIYGDGFLNISDLKKMPAKLAGLITRYIR